MSLDALPFGVAHHMALAPFVWLGVLHLRGQRRGAEWWWLAAAFAVSWLADTAAHWVAPWIVSAVYPLSQAALVGLVFLLRREAMQFLGVLLVVGVAAVVLRGVAGPDVLLRTVAWGAVVGIVIDRPIGRLRIALLVYFGLGLVCWWGYSIWSGWTSWSLYQVARALGIGLFCWAVLKPGPAFRVER